LASGVFQPAAQCIRLLEPCDPTWALGAVL
jgi:hypothetical protein